MFKIFQKKEQYGKVSSKFKDHFQHRDSKVNFVTSNDTKIQDKMKVFKELINDDFKPKENTSVVKLSYLRQNKRPRANQFQQKQINQLVQMTDGFIEWANLKHHKNKQKEEPFSWSHYKDQKQQRKQKDSGNFKETLKEKLDLKQFRKTHQIERFQNDMKNKIQHNVFQRTSQKPFHMTCRSSPNKKNYFFEIYKERHKKKYKLAKYFGEMKQFSCHKKFYSELKGTVDYGSRSMTRGNKTLLVAPFEAQISRIPLKNDYQYKENNSFLDRRQSLQKVFEDNKIYEDMKIIKRRQQKQRNTYNETVNYGSQFRQQKNQSQMTQESVQNLTKMPQKLLHSLSQKVSRVSYFHEKSLINSRAKDPIDMKKLKAVKKIKCI